MVLKARQLIPLLGLLWLGCSAPRDNPLDPESSHYHPPAAPLDVTARVRSMHISRNFPTTDTYLVIAELYGPDAQKIDSAWVTYKSFPAETLGRDTSADVWVTNFSPPYFDATTLASFIGHPFVFTACDEARPHTFGPLYLFRAIEQVPLLASPVNRDTVDSQPTLVWPVFNVGYPFEYLVTVISESAGDTSWNSLLPSSVLSARVPVVLADGPYQWTITVIDEFSNSSRSKESHFIVAAALLTQVNRRGGAGADHP